MVAAGGATGRRSCGRRARWGGGACCGGRRIYWRRVGVSHFFASLFVYFASFLSYFFLFLHSSTLRHPRSPLPHLPLFSRSYSCFFISIIFLPTTPFFCSRVSRLSALPLFHPSLPSLPSSVSLSAPSTFIRHDIHPPVYFGSCQISFFGLKFLSLVFRFLSLPFHLRAPETPGYVPSCVARRLPAPFSLSPSLLSAYTPRLTPLLTHLSL
ncbi:hypothetical protein C8R44DRAFT_411079 [Mycena epipterygia]|nr:hypothetical protein C8R44DRAFT_411079 [Mycena epipterygia]